MLRTLLLALVLATAPEYVFSQEKLRIVATSADLKSLAEVVGGERVQVESLATPEQDPHTFEIKPAQLARVRGAVLVIRVGLDHEPWFSRLRLPAGASVLDASKNVQLLQTQTPRLRAERAAHVHAYGNTHYWLYPENALAITADIRDALTRLSRQDAALFDANRKVFTAALRKKIGQWQAAMAPFRGRKIVVMHDSWTYLAERFGLQIVAAAEPHPGVPPSAAELARLLNRMRETGVSVIVADPNSNPALVNHIAAKSGAQAVTLFPSGHDYLILFDENVSRLIAALKRTAL